MDLTERLSRVAPGCTRSPANQLSNRIISDLVAARISLSIALAFILAACGGGSSATQPRAIDTAVLADCLQKYHPATPDPMPAGGLAGLFASDVTYALPCEALTPAGKMEWSVLVVARDGVTIRIYFEGGRFGDRCGLLRKITVVEGSSSVDIELQAGSDPGLAPTSACTAAGQQYVTQISLSKPLGSRSLSGPNNQGEIEHLN